MLKSGRRVRARNPFLYPLIAIVALALIAGGGYTWYRQQQGIAQANIAATSAAVQATSQGQTAVAQVAQGAVTATAAAALAEIERQYQAALAFQSAGDNEQARAGFQKVITLAPSYKDTAARLKQTGDALAEGYYQQAVAAADQKLWPDAVANFDKVLALAPNYKDTATRRAAAAKALDATSTPKPATPTAQPTAEPGATIPITATAVGDTSAPTATPVATSPVAATPGPTPGPSFAGQPGKHAQAIAAVESEHPYKNDEDKSWTIPNDSGKSAARIHFSRIELENTVDQIELRDAEDRLIQAITASAPDGLWSDLVPGAVIKVVLKSESSGNFWGFAIDKIEPIDLTTLAYSPHPYPNSSTESKVLINDTPNPSGTRVHFDFIDMEDGVDYLVIRDVDDTPYQWITGHHPDGFTSKAVPGSSIKVQLVSDGSGRAWGYNIDKLETAPAEKADLPPDHPKALAESDHPYANEFSKVWTITNPDVNAASSKIHFSRIDTEQGWDTIQILDSDDTIIQILTGHSADLWSDYVPGRVVKMKLITNGCCGVDWGFRVDGLVSSVANPGLAQSDHSYGNKLAKIWTLTNPDVQAASSKIHFSRIDTEQNWDTIQILDSDDTIIQVLTGHSADLWSDYVPGRVVKIKLITNDCCSVDWGFRVDALVSSVANPGLAQSDHPYGNKLAKIWTLTNPDVQAKSSKVHFSRIDTEQNWDTIQILDSNDTVIQTLTGHSADLWSDYVPGRVVKIKLITNDCCSVDWGFRVDDIQTVK